MEKTPQELDPQSGCFVLGEKRGEKLLEVAVVDTDGWR